MHVFAALHCLVAVYSLADSRMVSAVVLLMSIGLVRTYVPVFFIPHVHKHASRIEIRAGVPRQLNPSRNPAGIVGWCGKPRDLRSSFFQSCVVDGCLPFFRPVRGGVEWHVVLR